MNTIHIKESTSHGRGMYAAKDFSAGEVIMEWNIERELTSEELASLPESERPYVSEDGDGAYVLIGEPDRFMNHSCDPNTEARGRSNVAVRNISAGEELTTDYDKEGAQFSFACSCGSSNCRRSVGRKEV